MTPEELFNRAIPEPNSGCWLWLGAVDKYGYGIVKSRPNTYAHRASYAVHCGEIAPGGCILHSCDQPSCINPQHLRVGTQFDNSQDRVKRGRARGPKGVAHGSAKLTDDDVRAIRIDPRSSSKVGAEYGVHRAQIGRIRSRQLWSHVF